MKFLFEFILLFVIYCYGDKPPETLKVWENVEASLNISELERQFVSFSGFKFNFYKLLKVFNNLSFNFGSLSIGFPAKIISYSEFNVDKLSNYSKPLILFELTSIFSSFSN